MKELAKCPNCGKNNKITAKFCESCGTTLNEVSNISKQDNIQKSEQSAKSASIFDQIKNFWNARDTKGKAVTGVAACCLGVIIIGVIGGALFPDKAISIGFNNATYDGVGEYHIDINNSTTEYVISGYTEDGTNLMVSSTDLNISAQMINLTSSNTFTYKVKVPTNVNNAKVRFDAVKADKENTSAELTIKRQSAASTTQQSTNTPTQPTITQTLPYEYTIGNSKFRLSEQWKEGFRSSGAVGLERIRLDKTGKAIIMTQFFDKSKYLSEGENAVNKVTISGIQCKKVSGVMTYFFEKNGKYYYISVSTIDSSGNFADATAADVKYVEEIVDSVQ